MPISVVIPAYNEEATIEKCIRTVLDQGDAVAEVIVVDNDSTDATAAIVDGISREHPIVRLISESVPGVLAARSAGLDAATGAIIARIDADTAVEPGWASAVEDFFERAGDEFGAVSGPIRPYDLPFQGMMESLTHRITNSMDTPHREVSIVMGCNMAITAQAWKMASVREKKERTLNEDVGLSIALSRAGVKMAVDFSMRAGVSGRRMTSNPWSYFNYLRTVPRTYAEYGLTKEARIGWINVALSLVNWTIFYVPNRAFEPKTQSWSIRRLISPQEGRIDPHR